MRMIHFLLALSSPLYRLIFVLQGRGGRGRGVPIAPRVQNIVKSENSSNVDTNAQPISMSAESQTLLKDVLKQLGEPVPCRHSVLNFVDGIVSQFPPLTHASIEALKTILFPSKVVVEAPKPAMAAPRPTAPTLPHRKHNQLLDFDLTDAYLSDGSISTDDDGVL